MVMGILTLNKGIAKNRGKKLNYLIRNETIAGLDYKQFLDDKTTILQLDGDYSRYVKLSGTLDGEIVSVISINGVMVCIWDPDTNKLKRSFRLKCGHPIDSLTVSPEGEIIAIGRNDFNGDSHVMISIYDLQGICKDELQMRSETKMPVVGRLRSW